MNAGDGGCEPAVAVAQLTAVTDDEVAGLADVLRDCVEGGASVGFVRPLSDDRLRQFWRTVASAVERGATALLVATDDRGIVGTVQLRLDLPENQPHRADVAKLLVHRRARGRGVGGSLMAAAEALAGQLGRTLLVLDTVTGSDAERLYTRSGWQRCGVIPRYALWPDGRPCNTTVLYRDLATSTTEDGAPSTGQG